MMQIYFIVRTLPKGTSYFADGGVDLRICHTSRFSLSQCPSANKALGPWLFVVEVRISYCVDKHTHDRHKRPVPLFVTDVNVFQ